MSYQDDLNKGDKQQASRNLAISAVDAMMNEATGARTIEILDKGPNGDGDGAYALVVPSLRDHMVPVSGRDKNDEWHDGDQVANTPNEIQATMLLERQRLTQDDLNNLRAGHPERIKNWLDNLYVRTVVNIYNDLEKESPDVAKALEHKVTEAAKIAAAAPPAPPARPPAHHPAAPQKPPTAAELQTAQTNLDRRLSGIFNGLTGPDGEAFHNSLAHGGHGIQIHNPALRSALHLDDADGGRAWRQGLSDPSNRDAAVAAVGHTIRAYRIDANGVYEGLEFSQGNQVALDRKIESARILATSNPRDFRAFPGGSTATASNSSVLGVPAVKPQGGHIEFYNSSTVPPGGLNTAGRHLDPRNMPAQPPLLNPQVASQQPPAPIVRVTPPQPSGH